MTPESRSHLEGGEGVSEERSGGDASATSEDAISERRGHGRPEGAQFSTEGGHGAVPLDGVPSGVGVPAPEVEWPLYEVFVRGKRGLNHVHVGSLHAADDRMALLHARDVYTRRNEGVSIWVVRADAVTASSPDEKDPMFAPSGDKVYRHPTFYDIPDDVPHM